MSLDQILEIGKETIKIAYGSSRVELRSHKCRFQITPNRYLEFARKELITAGGDSQKINVMGHLKRALDCQVETFFDYLGILDSARKSLRSAKTKFEYLGILGGISSSSVERLIAIRNKMEHEFSVPDISELQAYYDLIQAYVVLFKRMSTFPSEILFTSPHNSWKYCLNENGEISIFQGSMDDDENFIADENKSTLIKFTNDSKGYILGLVIMDSLNRKWLGVSDDSDEVTVIEEAFTKISELNLRGG